MFVRSLSQSARAAVCIPSPVCACVDGYLPGRERLQKGERRVCVEADRAEIKNSELEKNPLLFANYNR